MMLSSGDMEALKIFFFVARKQKLVISGIYPGVYTVLTHYIRFLQCN